MFLVALGLAGRALALPPTPQVVDRTSEEVEDPLFLGVTLAAWWH